MKNEDLQALTNSIKEKLGEESAALIADDLGVLITRNNEVIETLDKQSKEITTLKDTNEKLVLANGSLLQQVPMGKKEEPVKESEKKSFNFSSVFDEHGNFKK